MAQLLQGDFLSQRTFRRAHMAQLLGFRAAAVLRDDEVVWLSCGGDSGILKIWQDGTHVALTKDG